MKKIGFLINPIAGMGGKVGLKGTDGDEILQEAINRGATPVAIHKARSFFVELQGYSIWEKAEFFLPQGAMGTNIFDNGAIKSELFTIHILEDLEIPLETTEKDTKHVVKAFKDLNVDLILFVGGDGTAQDVVSVIGDQYPLLGIPSGVKIHSGVFAQTPEKCAEIILQFLQNNIEFVETEIIDLDENAFRQGMLNTKLYGTGLVPRSPSLMQFTKISVYGEDKEDDNIQGIVRTLSEEITPDTLYFLGSGSTIKKIAKSFNKKIEKQKSLLGIDAVYNNTMLKVDLSESDILELINKYSSKQVVFFLTPIGGQGFILGRGNQQISPEVLRKVGIQAIQIIATRSKIFNLPNRIIHVDTGDKLLDEEFYGYHKVLVDYNEYWMLKIA
jgi:predicted polyphosphate/ATP-dependent NAD kinase